MAPYGSDIYKDCPKKSTSGVGILTPSQEEEIYVGGISATKPCRNLLGRRKTLYLSILNGAQCVKNITTNWSDLRICMKINQMHSIIHKLPKSIATSRFHCAYKCEKVRQLYSLCRMQVLIAPN